MELVDKESEDAVHAGTASLDCGDRTGRAAVEDHAVHTGTVSLDCGARTGRASAEDRTATATLAMLEVLAPYDELGLVYIPSKEV
jgi:hypothetical protein